MKKNISINLQGMIFHIEEDGYEQLSQYLAAIKSYFSAYEGHEEIIADIESRIGEIFFTKLNPSKQVITREDVQALIAQMGSVADFQGLEEEEPVTAGAAQPGFNQQNTSSTFKEPSTGSKRIYTDQIRKVLGGVAAGIANYLDIDPLPVRLFFVFLVLIAPITAGISMGFVVFAYILCWIAFPKSYVLPETTSKKLFRNPIDKKLGGVASGMAYFFGIDVAVIRLLFLIFAFVGGFGFIVYVVLWIIVPEASSITDRVQMQGNPVTLSSIEESLKNNLRMKDENGQESSLAKVILFPVRLVAQVLQFLARVLNPLLSFLVVLIRILAGTLLMVVASAIIFALFVMGVTALGLVDGSSIIQLPNDMPFSLFLNSFPAFGIVAGFFALLIPAIFLLMLGLGLLLKKFHLRGAVGWSMFAIWILSIFFLVLGIVAFQKDFRERGEFTSQKTFPVANYRTYTLNTRNVNDDGSNTGFEIQGYAGPDVKLIQLFEADGFTEAEAIKNAQMVTYRVEQKDSVITFDNSFKFKPDARFRDQRLNLKLLLPENKTFRISRDFAWRVNSSFERDYDLGDYETNVEATYLWQVKNNKLVCLNCPAPDTTAAAGDNFDGVNGHSDWQNESNNLQSPLRDEGAYGSGSRTFTEAGFETVTVSGAYHVRIRPGNTFAVNARGEGRGLENLEIRRDGQELVISPRRKFINLDFDDEDEVLVTITMPNLETLNLTGAVKADVAGFKNQDFRFTGTGAVESLLRIDSRNVEIVAAGACQTTLAGQGDRLEIKGAGACQTSAEHFKAANAEVGLAGASEARVFVTNTLDADVAGPSTITYRGNPRTVNASSPGIGTIEKENEE